MEQVSPLELLNFIHLRVSQSLFSIFSNFDQIVTNLIVYFKLDTDIEIEPLTPLGLGLQTTNLGIFVTSVQPGSVGDIFGYRFGDQILSINNQVVHTSDDIRRIR